MNGSGRKYTSKWDLKEDSHLYHKDVQGDMLRTKHGEPASRNRGNEDYGNNMKLTTRSAVDGDHNRENSPGLEGWSRHDRTCSPRNSLSRSLRSRSRSPVHGFGRHLEYNDRIRRRPGSSTQLCKDFAVGRCKRGSYCQYSHDNNGGHETAEMEDGARRYHNYSVAGDHYPRSDRSTEICNRFLRGQCLRGSSCKYIHDSASNAHSQGSTDEMFRERESNRSNRYRTYEQRDERGSGSVPCRYFAAGNCRNGRYCRFSHGHPASSPDRRSRDRNLGQHHSVDAAEKVFKEPKWSDPNSVSEVVTLRENRNEKVSDLEQKVTCWSMDEARDSSFNSGNKMVAVQNERHSNFDKSERKVFQLENEATGSSLGVSGTRDTVSLPVETTMSPFWNYNVQASTQPFTQELKTGSGDKAHVNSKIATENVVCGEELNQLSNLSTTLAQLIANGQQLPQIYASLSSHIPVDMPSFANSEEAVQPVPPAPSQSNPATASKQYDPISDSENLELPNINNQHSTLLTEPGARENSAAVPNTEQVFLDNAPKSGGVENNNNLQKNICSETYRGNHNLNPVEGLANSTVTGETDRMGAYQSDKLQDDEKVINGGGPLENENTVSKVEEGKKEKNLKGLRTFKFALVEVVKELLKPAWKEGKIDKEVHKIIVKKAVDKVTGALQEVNIPQTKEKIDNYLSSSKPKLTKLVEAYVEKFHKSKPEREAA